LIFQKIFKDFFVSVFTAWFFAFGGIWTFSEPLGLETGIDLFLILLFSSLAISLFYTLIKSLINLNKEFKTLKNEIIQKNTKIEQLLHRESYCCVIGQDTSVCPLGVKSIVPKMKTTLISPIEEARHTYKWMGLSAFNVVHNNKDLFEKKKYVRFEFVIADQSNDKLINEVDAFYGDTKGRLGAKQLISQSNSILNELISDGNPNIKIVNHNQMPTFRVILIDERIAYVSFYERGVDALDSIQIKIEDDPSAKFPIFKWFSMFYEKILITEKIVASKS